MPDQPKPASTPTPLVYAMYAIPASYLLAEAGRYLGIGRSVASDDLLHGTMSVLTSAFLVWIAGTGESSNPRFLAGAGGAFGFIAASASLGTTFLSAPIPCIADSIFKFGVVILTASGLLRVLPGGSARAAWMFLITAGPACAATGLSHRALLAGSSPVDTSLGWMLGIGPIAALVPTFRRVSERPAAMGGLVLGVYLGVSVSAAATALAALAARAVGANVAVWSATIEIPSRLLLVPMFGWACAQASSPGDPTFGRSYRRFIAAAGATLASGAPWVGANMHAWLLR